MEFNVILRKGKVVTPEGILEGDIGISGGKIQKIGAIPEKGEMERIVDGFFVLPGVIDMHVHLRDPGFPEKEDFASGSAAAAAGGVTTVVDMPNTDPPVLTVAILEEKRRIAASKSYVNFGLYFGVSIHNLDEVRKARGILGVKVYMGSSTGSLLVQDLNIIEELFKMKKFVIVHAEDEKMIREKMKKYEGSNDSSAHSLIRSPEAAYEATKAVLHLAKKMNGRVHITHVSTAMEVEELRKFKSPLVSADAAPHHLYLTQSAYAERGNFVKVNPPLRTQTDRQALWKGMKEGLIQAVASDHAPHTKAEKELPYSQVPAGIPGLETMLPLLLDSVNHGELSLFDVVRLTSENPAVLLGLKTKGKIVVGADADITVLNMNEERTVGDRPFFSKCGWSPFSGWKLKGWPVMTLVGGQIAYENGKIFEECRGRDVNAL